MSRFKEWTSAENGLGTFAEKHIELDVRNQKGKTNKFYRVEIRKLINRFSKRNKIVGSYSERVLIISRKHYQGWRDFIIATASPLPDMYDLQEQDLKNIARNGQSNNL